MKATGRFPFFAQQTDGVRPSRQPRLGQVAVECLRDLLIRQSFNGRGKRKEVGYFVWGKSGRGRGAGALAVGWVIAAYSIFFGILLVALGFRLRGLSRAVPART